MNIESLQLVAKALVAPHKGILAADESLGTIKNRLSKIELPSSPENRRTYRQLLFTTPEIEKNLSGIILFDETIRQSTNDGTPFIKLISDRGIIPGIKVDLGTELLPGSDIEKTTKGLTDLSTRLTEYYSLGAKFTKWRAVFTVSNTTPSNNLIEQNASDLAKYAKFSQEADLVPIVESEVLADGNYTIEQYKTTTKKVLVAVFEALKSLGVDFSAILLKPNMIINSLDSLSPAPATEVASKTINLLTEVVPAKVPGIVFLSGGQSAREACTNLNKINQIKNLPWQISFSYGRALQDEALEIWQGKQKNVTDAQKVFLHRLKLVSAARDGKYSPDME